MRLALLLGAAAALRCGPHPHLTRPKQALTRLYAAPRKKLPVRRVDVACAGCRAPLFKYAKGNGAGSKLVKCWAERIVKDYTEDGVTCPKCGAVFAREALVRGRPAFKIVSGKVRVS